MMKKISSVAAMGAVIAAMGIAPVLASADTGTNTQNQPAQAMAHRGWGQGEGRHMPGVFGTVTAINGSTITVTQKGFAHPENSDTATANANQASAASGTTYSIDASNATVTKDGASSSVAAIAVGDTVMVEGTVNGTSVTATTIRDGMPQMGKKQDENGTSSAPIIQGNGQPVVAGKVTAISGSTLSITNASNVSYTVDASGATFAKGNTASDISGIAVGDNLIVQGTVNGSSVTASSVIDQGSASSSGNSLGGKVAGFFHGIGGFFAHLFGF